MKVEVGNPKYTMNLDPPWKKLQGLPFNQLLNTSISLKQEIITEQVFPKNSVSQSIL